MKIKKLISYLIMLQEEYPDAEIYFTDGNNQEWFETYFQTFNIDEENNMIEMLFDTEEV
jgi:N-acetylneuraminic acid mutarotase